MTKIKPSQIKRSVKTITSSTYTLQTEDAYGYIRFNNASGVTVTLPNTSDRGQTLINNIGEGDVTFNAGTIISPDNVVPAGAAAMVVNSGSDERGVFIAAAGE